MIGRRSDRVFFSRENIPPSKIARLQFTIQFFLPFWFPRAAVDGGTMPLTRKYPTILP
jgi:hypothetical protein